MRKILTEQDVSEIRAAAAALWIATDKAMGGTPAGSLARAVGGWLAIRGEIGDLETRPFEVDHSRASLKITKLEDGTYELTMELSH